jgi:tetratricopeptide (TPR) repeat protein
MRTNRTLLYIAVTGIVLASGCGKMHMDKQRDEARQRWANSRAEMVTKLAQGCYDRGDTGRAQQHLDEGLRTNTPYSPMYVLAARIASDKGNLDLARQYAGMAKTADPKSAEARYVLGTMEQMIGSNDKALAEFSEAVRLEPRKPAYALAEAELLVAQKQPELAAKALLEASERMPGQTELHAALGDVCVNLRLYQQAVASYRIAIRLDPKQTEVNERLAAALFYSGAYAEAESMLAELSGSLPEFANGWAAAMRAECLMAMGRTARARQILVGLSEAKNDSAAPLVGLAKCDILEKSLPSARANLEQALKRDARHAEANALMGYVLVAMGRPGEATPHLALALQQPDTPGRATVERLLAQAKSMQEKNPQ